MSLYLASALLAEALYIIATLLLIVCKIAIAVLLEAFTEMHLQANATRISGGRESSEGEVFWVGANSTLNSRRKVPMNAGTQVLYIRIYCGYYTVRDSKTS